MMEEVILYPGGLLWWIAALWVGVAIVAIIASITTVLAQLD